MQAFPILSGDDPLILQLIQADVDSINLTIKRFKAHFENICLICLFNSAILLFTIIIFCVGLLNSMSEFPLDVLNNY